MRATDVMIAMWVRVTRSFSVVLVLLCPLPIVTPERYHGHRRRQFDDRVGPLCGLNAVDSVRGWLGVDGIVHWILLEVELGGRNDLWSDL